MKHISFTYWIDGEYYVGYLNDFPDNWTQGTSLEDLTENLKSLFEDIETEEIPYIRHISEIERKLTKKAFVGVLEESSHGDHKGIGATEYCLAKERD